MVQLKDGSRCRKGLLLWVQISISQKLEELDLEPITSVAKTS